MKLTLFIIFLLITDLVLPENALRETRAVWLTTNFSLDWPPKTYDEEKQKGQQETVQRGRREA